MPLNTLPLIIYFTYLTGRRKEKEAESSHLLVTKSPVLVNKAESE